MLLMRLRIVRRQAMCLRPPCQTARLTLVVLPFNNRISISTWRMFFFSVPRGPVTVMRRDLMETSTFSGMLSSSALRTLCIYIVEEEISKTSSELPPLASNTRASPIFTKLVSNRRESAVICTRCKENQWECR